MILNQVCHKNQAPKCYILLTSSRSSTSPRSCRDQRQSAPICLYKVDQPTTMADTPAPAQVPMHPVAPRMTNRGKKPHIGPHIDDYHKAHKETIGHESDAWWAKVSSIRLVYLDETLTISIRWREIPCTGTVPSILFVPVDLRQATLHGSPRVDSMHRTTVSIAGRLNILTRQV